LRRNILTILRGLIAAGCIAMVLPAAASDEEPERLPEPQAVDADMVRRLVDERLKEIEAKKKADEEQAKRTAEEKGVEVGSNLNLSASWDNGLVFLTPNKDWRIHIGGRLQFDSVWWRQPDFLKGPPPGNGGVPDQGPGGGVGPLDDGTFFRRVRLRTNGVGYELVEYDIEVDFEQLNQITFDHLWVGFKGLPFLGTLRIGQQKVPQGMDMLNSDYHLTFLERSALSDAFWTLFAPGVLVANTYFDDRVTTQTMLHKVQPLQVYNGAAFGDGNYAATTRATWTPVYEIDGVSVVHLGGSYQYRTGNLGRTIGGTGDAFADTQDVIRFRARPELRDAVGVGTVSLIGGNAVRFVDTGFLLGDRVQTISPEFLLICGPWSVQAEAAFAFADNVRSIYPASAFGTPRGDPTFWGAYIQTSYLLTGEHRGYNRRFGTADRIRNNENFFLVRGDDGRFHYGIGAWELAYRYSYLDLNDNGINGGQMNEHTVGLNWYFNDNMKVQFNYLNIQRNVAAPANSGTVHGFGILTQWYF
jgi:phosphate-selective porin OprO/OprP